MNNENNYNPESNGSIEVFDAQKNSINNYTLNPETKEKLEGENNVDSYLVRKYIGANADKLLGNTVNVPAFFFSGLYYFYRKMYLYGIVFLIIDIAILFLPYYYFWLLVFRLLLLFSTNKIYISSVYNDVQFIKESNKDKKRDDIARECSRSGGAHISGIIVGIILSGVLSFALYYALTAMGVKLPEYGNIGAVWQSISGTSEPKSYNGKLSCNYIDLKRIDYDIPSGFKKKRNFQELKATMKTKDETCILSLRSVSLYKDPDTLSTQMSNYYGLSLKEEVINGNTWNTFTLSKGNFDIKYYIGGFENDVYIYSYTYNSSSCIDKDKPFLESLDIG